MELKIATATDRGRVREQNEDAVLADEPLVAVADGMGGHKAGEVASNMALEVVAGWKERLLGSSGKTAAEMLRRAFEEANRTVWERGQQDENLLGMGTTLTAGWVDGGSVALAHVGDSRAYLLRDGKLRQLTHDQNVAQDLVRRGRLSEDEAATSPQRHVILQAIGADPDGLEVEVANVNLQPGDRLLLASDGLYGMLHVPDRIREILVEQTDPAEACRVLIEAANVAGGEDNISVLVVDAVSTDGVHAPSPGGAPDVQIDRPAPTPAAKRDRGPGVRWPIVAAAVALVAVLAGALLVLRAGNDLLLVAERNGNVVVLKGKPGVEGRRATGDVVRVLTPEKLDRFPRTVREDLREGIPVESMSEARRVVDDLPRLLGPRDTPAPSPSPTPSASPGTAALPLPRAVP